MERITQYRAIWQLFYRRTVPKMTKYCNTVVPHAPSKRGLSSTSSYTLYFYMTLLLVFQVWSSRFFIIDQV